VIFAGQEIAIPCFVLAIRRTIAKIHPRQKRAVEYYSCFISYAWKDQDFAARLHDDLQEVGVRSWLDARELKVGESISEQVGKAIQVHDKVLLVLSQASARSPWVSLEVRNALQLERERRKTVLFPIRIDNAVLGVFDLPKFDRLREKYVSDFSDWQDPGRYRQAFSRLVRDLAISASVESERHS
jgi:hypothetical protein